ncbi:MAG TPA: hypothetical protein VLA66_02135 [Thermoanaerobaculia bacterium]|nr:hypothetical protein [Thermoanaerobaculia bacterium]
MSDRAALRWGIVIVVAWAIAAALSAHPEVAGLRHDDGIYLSTAKSLAEGRGYRLIHLPGEPAQTKYPPLFPMLLAPVWIAAPEWPANVYWFKLVGITTMAVALLLFQRVARRVVGLSALGSLAALLICAASPLLLGSASWVLSEPLFAACVAGALLATGRAASSTPASRAAILAGALAGAATLVRLQGVVLVAAIPAALLLEGRRRDAGRALVAGAAPVAAWWGWCALQPPPASPLLSYYVTYSSFVSPWGYGRGPGSLLAVIGYRWLDLPVELGNLLLGGGPLDRWIGFGFLAALGAGCAVAGHRGRWAAPLTAAAAVGLTLVVPWSHPRFLLPWMALLVALAALPFDLGSPPARRIGGALALCLAVAGGVHEAQAVLAADPTSLPEADGRPTGRGEWSGWLETARWLRENTPQGAIVASNHDPFYYLFGERRGIRFQPFRPPTGETAPPAPDPRWVLSQMRRLGVGWMVLDPGGVELDRAGVSALALGRAIVGLPEARANRLFASADGAHEVWRLGAARAPDSPAETPGVSMGGRGGAR